jgi:hypothetical protein
VNGALALSGHWRSGRNKIGRTARTGLAIAIAVATAACVPARATSAPLPAKADPALADARRAPSSTLPVIVRESTPASTLAEALVRRLAGHVTHELPIIGRFSADLPARGVTELSRSSSMLKVWGDATDLFDHFGHGSGKTDA